MTIIKPATALVPVPLVLPAVVELSPTNSGTGAEVPTSIDAGLSSDMVTASAGMPTPLMIALTVLCVAIALFALAMSAGALWRIVPANWRRAL
jgi:hypothetical protein